MAFRDLVAAMDARLVDSLGEPSTYITSDGVSVSPNGIFDERHEVANVGMAGIASSQPAMFYRLIDLPNDPELDEPQVVHDGVRFSVDEVKKDGQGGVWLILGKRL